MKDTLIIMTSPVGTGKRAFIEKARLAGLTIVEPTVEFLDATSAQEFKANFLHEIRSNIGKADFIFVPVGKPIVDLLRIEDIKFSTIFPADTPEMREYWGVEWEDKELFSRCWGRAIRLLKGTNPWNIHFEISEPGDTIEDVLLSLGYQISHQPEPTTMNTSEPTTMNTSEPKKTVIISAVLSQAAEVCTVRNSCTANLSMECLNIDPVLRDKTENYAEVWVKEVQARIGKMDVLFIPAVKEACDPLSKAGIEFVSMCSLYSATIPHGKADPHNPWGYVAYYGGSIAMSDSVSMLVEMRQNNVSFSWLDVPGVYFFTNPQGKGAVQITAEILNMTARDMVVFVEDSAKLKGCNLTISIDTFSGLCDPDKLPAKGIKAKANAVANILKGYGGILGSVMYHIATSPDAKLREDMIALLDLPKDMSDDAKLTLRKAVVNEAKLTLRKAVANDAKLTFQAAVAGLPELK